MKNKKISIKKTQKKALKNKKMDQNIIDKIEFYSKIVENTILYVQKYKILDILNASQLNECIEKLLDINSSLLILQDFMKTNQSNTDFNEIYDKLQIINNELSFIFRNYGTKNVVDLLNIVFGSQYIENNDLQSSKFNLIKKYLHPVNYKVMEWKGDSKTDKNKQECTIVYGLDADLIMLALNHLPISKHIYLYRETPEFIKSINMDLNPNESYILDIPELSQTIISSMNNGRQVNNKQQTNRLYDYIFLCFFLGNDFLPHFPAVNIRTKGIEIMLNSYKKLFGNTNKNLTNGSKIYWNNVNLLINDLAEYEWKNLISEYKIRERQEKFCMKNENEMERYLKIPIRNREIEKYIAFIRI